MNQDQALKAADCDIANVLVSLYQKQHPRLFEHREKSPAIGEMFETTGCCVCYALKE
jgi:hypothetical protein